MATPKCPDCGTQKFYVKDPEDQFNICEFNLTEDGIEYIDTEDNAEHLDITEETETYCDRCAWHDKFKSLK